MQAVTTAQVMQDRLISGLETYLSSVEPTSAPGGSTPASKANATIATRREKYGSKTISRTSLQGLVESAKARRAGGLSK